MDDYSGFISALFNLQFTESIARPAVRVLYVISMVAVVLATLIFISEAFRAGALPGLGSLVAAPVLFLAGVIVCRVALETVLVLFRISENLRMLMEEKRRTNDLLERGR